MPFAKLKLLNLSPGFSHPTVTVEIRKSLSNFSGTVLRRRSDSSAVNLIRLSDEEIAMPNYRRNSSRNAGDAAHCSGVMMLRFAGEIDEESVTRSGSPNDSLTAVRCSLLSA
jgi:hypothetical protein